MPEKNRIGFSAAVLLAVSACNGGSSGSNTAPAGAVGAMEVCEGFGAWQTSPFVLPYTVGDTYRLNQGNCSGFGHSGFWKYGYDFDMPIGTVVIAARDGEVVHAQDGAANGDRTRTNLITIEHDDGSVALYSHLTLNGVHVTIGQHVLTGDVIGLSGDTGNTGGLPHLHFSLHPCRSLPGLPGTDSCPTIPANFRNTDANPVGPTSNRSYEALPFTVSALSKPQNRGLSPFFEKSLQQRTLDPHIFAAAKRSSPQTPLNPGVRRH